MTELLQQHSLALRAVEVACGVDKKKNLIFGIALVQPGGICSFPCHTCCCTRHQCASNFAFHTFPSREPSDPDTARTVLGGTQSELHLAELDTLTETSKASKHNWSKCRFLGCHIHMHIAEEGSFFQIFSTIFSFRNSLLDNIAKDVTNYSATSQSCVYVANYSVGSWKCVSIIT